MASKPEPLPRLCYSMAEIARMTGRSVPFIKQEILTGRLRAHWLGAKTRSVMVSDLEAWLKGGGTDPVQPELVERADRARAALQGRAAREAPAAQIAALVPTV